MRKRSPKEEIGSEQGGDEALPKRKAKVGKNLKRKIRPFRTFIFRNPVARCVGKEAPTLYDPQEFSDEDDASRRLQRQRDQFEYFQKEQIPVKVCLQKAQFKNSNFEETTRFLLTNHKNPPKRDQDKDQKANVEVMISQNKVFENQSVMSKIIPVDEFFAYRGSLNLYIAQYPLLNRLRPENFFNIKSEKRLKTTLKAHRKRQISNLARKLILPTLVADRMGKLDRVNLWASRKKTVSKLHFDFYDNILVVLKGSKTVYLLPPGSAVVKNDPQKSFTFHQGKIDCSEIKGTNLKKRVKKGRILRKFCGPVAKNWSLWESGLVRVSLHPGQGCYIPEGWYHYVVSSPETVAVNFWFESVFRKINKNFQQILNLMIKRTIAEDLESKSDILIRSWGLDPSQFAPISIKRTLIKFLIEKKIDLKKILEKGQFVDRVFLDFVLKRLQKSDELINAERFVFENSALMKKEDFGDREGGEEHFGGSSGVSDGGVALGGHTDDLKENFYQFFSIYFDEQKRIQALDSCELVFKKFSERPISTLFK